MNRHARTLSLLTAGVLALGTLAGCAGASGADAGSANDNASDTSGWSYLSGDGETYTLDEVPTRIIAHAYSAKALMEFGITPIAIYADNPIKEDVGLKGVDFSGVEVIGEEWGKIDIEAAAQLTPDLIVGDWWPAENAYSGIEGGVEESSKKLSDLAPIVGPAQGDSIVSLIEGYADLAETLGADPTQIADARETFETAVSDFEAANKENPEVSALAVSPFDADYYVAAPKYAPELLDFQEWGLNVIVPDSPDADFPYWETLSMEKADKYQPDLLMFDDRNAPAGEETLAAAPISSEISAFAAGQTTLWPAYWMHTYSDYAEQLTRLADVIRDADPTVSAE